MNDDLWNWAVAAYDAPGVKAACLQLQDVNGQNVPLLLWAAWCARTGRRPDAEALEASCDVARAWDHNAVAPLRAVRDRLKAQIADMNPDARLALRDQIKAVELLAERGLLADLQAEAPDGIGPAYPDLDGLIAIARVWDRVVPRIALTALADSLPA